MANIRRVLEDALFVLAVVVIAFPFLPVILVCRAIQIINEAQDE